MFIKSLSLNNSRVKVRFRFLMPGLDWQRRFLLDATLCAQGDAPCQPLDANFLFSNLPDWRHGAA
jgi:hypothetical protein